MQVIGPDSAPPLVLANALGTTSRLWDGQLPVLRGFRVVRYEHPPLASVEDLARDVIAMADGLGVGRFSLCGVSLGGMVGMWLGAHAPERVDRLVLASTTARFGEPAEWSERAALVRAEGMSAVAHDALEKWLTPAYPDREPFLAMQLETPAEDYARGLEAIGGFDFREDLWRIGAPTLVVVGGADEATTPADAAFLAHGIPDARLAVLEGAAHLANVERVDAFNEAILGHLHA
jgi:3-oxoadipate enol-lactonase